MRGAWALMIIRRATDFKVGVLRLLKDARQRKAMAVINDTWQNYDQNEKRLNAKDPKENNSTRHKQAPAIDLPNRWRSPTRNLQRQKIKSKPETLNEN